MSSSQSRARLWILGTGAAGVALGHAVAYLLTIPDSHARAHFLHETGHAYWPWCVALAIGAGAGGFGFYIYDRSRPRASTPRRTLLKYAAIRLAAVQCVGFLALEAAERAASGHLGAVWNEPAVIAGLVVQAVLGLVGALFLVAADRIVDKLAAAARRWERELASSRTLHLSRPDPAFPKPAILAGGATLRGPPSRLIA